MPKGVKEPLEFLSATDNPLLHWIQAHHQFTEALYKAGSNPNRRFDNLHLFKAFENLFPKNAELHLGQPVSDTEMRAPAEGEMLFYILAVEGIGHTSWLPAQRPRLGVMLNP
jgi:hypothetical protein